MTFPRPLRQYALFSRSFFCKRRPQNPKRMHSSHTVSQYRHRVLVGWRRLPQAAGLALRLEEAQNVVFADCHNVSTRLSRPCTMQFLVCGVSAARLEAGVWHVPGPLTLRMMLRVVSSMNSTRTWVTPPREPVAKVSLVD